MKRTLLFLFSLLTLVYANALTWVPTPYVDGNAVATGATIEAGKSVSRVVLGVEGWGSALTWFQNCTPVGSSYLNDGSKVHFTVNGQTITPSSVTFTGSPLGVICDFEPALTEAGAYSVVVEEGLILPKDGSCAATVNDIFTIAGGGDTPEPSEGPEYTPAAGSTVGSFSSIKVKFPGAKEVSVYGANAYCTLYLDGVYGGANGNTDDFVVNGDEVTINVMTSFIMGKLENNGTAITAKGTYMVIFDAKTFIVDGEYTPELTYNFTVGDVEPEKPDYFENVQVSLATGGLLVEGLPVGYEVAKTIDDVKVAAPEGALKWGTPMSIPNSPKYAFFFYNSQDPTAVGDYKVTIPAGYFTYDGQESKELTYSWSIKPDYFEGYTSTFTEGVNIVSVVFPNAGNNVVFFAEGKSEADIVAIAEDGTQTPSNRANGATKTFNFQFSDVTADGTYTFEIPAGTLVIDDISNEKAITGSFTIEPKSTETYFDGAVFDPADGASVATLKVIKVTYSNVANGFGNIQYTTVKDKITLIGNGQTVNPIDVVAENSYPYQTIYITFDEVTDAGEYTLNIEKGTFNEFVSYGETPTNFNEAVSAKFTVTGGVKVETFGDAVWTPAEGAQVESVEVVTVNFPNLTGLLSEYSYAGDITLTCEGKELPWYGAEIAGTGATIRFAPNAENAITTPGEYTLTVPAGYFYDSTTGEDCPELTLHFTVVAPKASTLAEYTVDPEDGYTFKEGTDINVSIKFTKVVDIFGTEFSGITVVNENNEAVEVTAKKSSKYGNVLEISATGLKNGKYTLTVPAGIVCDWDDTIDWSNANEEIVLHYTLDSLDGVSAIFGDSDSFTVVTVDGVVLLKDADADALNQLPAGLYIVNGKKLVIRK